MGEIFIFVMLNDVNWIKIVTEKTGVGNERKIMEIGTEKGEELQQSNIESKKLKTKHKRV